MPLGYRAIVRLDEAEDAVVVAESQLSTWFREKKQRGNLTAADWDGEGEHELGMNAQLTVVHDQDRQDSSRRRLYRFRELNDLGAVDKETGKRTVVMIRDPDTMLRRP